jgi:multidrug resistance efflux pump
MRKLTKQTTNRYLLLLALLLATAAQTGCSMLNSGTATAQDADQSPVALSPYVIAEGRLMPKDSTWLSFGQGGKVVEILVEEGQVVEKGDLLARLGDREQIEASLAAAELERLNARQALDNLQRTGALAGSQAQSSLAQTELDLIEAQQDWDDFDLDQYQDDIDEAWKDVLDAEKAVEDAQEEFDKYKDFSAENTNRKNTEQALENAHKEYEETRRAYKRLTIGLDQRRTNLALAQERFAEAQWEYDQHQNGARAEDLALAQARLNNANAQVEAAQAALRHLELVAPFDGTIVDIQIGDNEWATPGKPAVLLADFSEWYVETTDLSELDVVRIDESQRVILVPDALPGVELLGTIEKTKGTYVELRGDILYTVRVKVQEIDQRLRWGMTIQVRFGENDT